MDAITTAAPTHSLRERMLQDMTMRGFGAHTQKDYNDGAVAYRDIGLTRTDRAWSFIERCWTLYRAAMDADCKLQGVGLREVGHSALRLGFPIADDRSAVPSGPQGTPIRLVRDPFSMTSASTTKTLEKL